jgi:hypothetical protein
VRRCIEQAKAGEPVAMRLRIERILPRAGPSLEVALPLIRRAEDVASACSEVIARAAAGEITLAEAKEFLGLLNTQRQAIETHDLAVRIEALQRREVER